MQGFAFNIRRPVFQDVRVRQALAWAYDFEWANRNLFYDSYTRSKSYYSNSDLASSGLPEGAELALLEPFRDKLRPEVFTQPFRLPVLASDRATLPLRILGGPALPVDCRCGRMLLAGGDAVKTLTIADLAHDVKG